MDEPQIRSRDGRLWFSWATLVLVVAGTATGVAMVSDQTHRVARFVETTGGKIDNLTTAVASIRGDLRTAITDHMSTRERMAAMTAEMQALARVAADQAAEIRALRAEFMALKTGR